MSIFFDKKLPVPVSAGTRIYLQVTWHKVVPLLAIIVDDERKGGLVAVYDHLKDETNDIEAESRAGVRVTCISWHPTEPLLAIGYDTGEVIIWNHTESESFEGAKNHIGTVVVLTWSHCGTNLVSADSYGSLVVWSSNVEGHIQPKSSHDFKEVVSQLVFRRPSGPNKTDTTERSLNRVTTWRPKTARREPNDVTRGRRDSSSTDNSTARSFFVGLLNGAIFYLKGDGTSEEVLTSGSSVKFLLYHHSRDILIVMTDAAILGQFEVDSKGGLNEVNKVKISGRGDINLSWVGVGTLAIVSDELSVRLIDVDTGDNFVLEPKGSLNFTADEYICAVDYNEKTGHLCCNTNKGKLIIWKEVNSRETSAQFLNEEERWEWLSTSPVSATSRISRWCPTVPDILAINAVRDIYILRQQEIVATYHNKVSIIQTLATQLAIHQVESKNKFYLETEIQVKGFTNTVENLCLWSGSQVEIYDFCPGENVPYKLCGTFKEKSDTIYLYEKNVFVLESHQIQVKSFQGTIKQTLTFTTDEGLPITLAGGGEYITAATDTGFLKIWHVGGREAKVHAPSKNLTSNIKNFGEIIQALNNIEGSKVAFTIAKTNLVPDSRFYVWDVGSDNLISMTFPGHFVSKICWEAEDPMYIALELTVIPVELRVAKDEEDENLQAVEVKGESLDFILSSNGYLALRARKGLRLRERSKYLKAFEGAEPPSLKELQQLIAEVEHPRQKGKSQRTPAATLPPWEIQEREGSGVYRSALIRSTSEADSYDLENESTTLRHRKPRGGDGDVDEGFIESPRSPPKKSKTVYKKPMPQSKRRFRAVVTTEVDEGDEVGDANMSTAPSGKVRTEMEQLEPTSPSRKSSVINLTSKKKYLDLAGFTRRSDGLTEEVKSEEIPANQILTLFVCSTAGILKHEKIVKGEGTEIFLGLDVPYCYTLSKTKGKNSEDSKSTAQASLSIERRTIADFKGVDDEALQDGGKQQREVKQALLSYVYHHLCGDVDKALVAMGNIQSLEIWRNMARLCLSSKRVDVASICFARMKNVGACRALRLCRKRDDDIEAQVAMVALQLDMLDEAERLYRGCGRFDLLVDMLIACEQWTRAIEVCDAHYRIQFKTTCFLYAKYLEEEGSVEDAIQFYEKAGTHKTDVMRMLHGNLPRLEKYVTQKKQKEIYKWWAQYLESIEDLAKAIYYYELAEDWLSLTRLLCFMDQLDKAREVAETVKDKASCYHLAGILHGAGNPDDAVLFYQRAEAYGPAMRICREHEMDEMLFNLSHLATPGDNLEAAKYFETKDPPDYEKAVRLYHKGGFSSKAMDIAYATQEFGALQDVARELLESSERKDPEMLKRCAEFFVANQQFSKALDIYASAKKYAEAMDVCVQYKIQIDEEMAERLTVPKGEEGIEPEERRRLLEKMAEACMLQGSYHLAAKKFTQAGNKEKAMKVLLKSGDTERIIHYANISRHRDIYLMAANYLQTTDWQRSPKTVDKIILFYTKAKMPESVVTFYDSWATSSYEVDRNYEASLDHLRKAESVLRELIAQETAGSAVKSYEQKLERIHTKIHNVNTFLSLKKSMKRSPVEAVQRLKTFVKDASIEGSVSRGDVFGLIIEYYVGNEEYEAAVDMLVEMKQAVSTKPGHFIRKETLEALNYALGKQSFQMRESSEASSGGPRRASFNFSQEVHDPQGEEEEVEEEEEEIEEVEEEIEEEIVEYEDEEEEPDVNQNPSGKSWKTQQYSASYRI